MWAVIERRDVSKQLRRLPKNIVQKYELWKDVASQGGPQALRELKGFHFEKLEDDRWSSKLTKGYRVIFSIMKGLLQIEVIHVGTHDVYKKNRSPVGLFDDKYRPARRWTRLTPALAIRNLREMQDMTQASVAKLAGLSQGLVSNLERGRVPLSLMLAKRLAKALNVSPVILLFP